MSRKLSKSKEEFLKNKGWSSCLFFDKAKKIIIELEKNKYDIDFGRTVIYIKKNNKTLKIYAHYNDTNLEYISFLVDRSIIEIFHYTTKIKEFLKFIYGFFEEDIK